MEFKQQYFDIWTECWALHKQFYGTTADDEPSWFALNHRYEELNKKYPCKFMEQLSTVVMAELERQANETPVK